MQMLQEKIEGRFFFGGGKLRGKLNIIIVLHFWYIYDILQAELFCDAQNAPNSFFAGALPRTPLGELTTLPQTSSQLGSVIPSPNSPSRRRLRSLTLS